MSPLFIPGGGVNNVGGAGGQSVKLLAERADFPMKALTDQFELPEPSSGKTYKYIEFEVLYGFGTDPSFDDSANEYVNSAHHGETQGKFFEEGTEKSSWYKGLNQQGVWDSGPNQDDSFTSYTVGILRYGQLNNPLVCVTIEYNPTTRRLFFQNVLSEAPTGSHLPHVISLMAVGWEG